MDDHTLKWIIASQNFRGDAQKIVLQPFKIIVAVALMNYSPESA